MYGSNDIVSQSLLFSHNWEQLNVNLYGTLARSLVGGWKYKPGEKQRSKIQEISTGAVLENSFSHDSAFAGANLLHSHKLHKLHVHF